MLGELRVASEAVHAGDLGDELGRGQHAAAADREQRRCLLLDQGGQLLLELFDSLGQLAAGSDELGGDPRLHGLRLGGEDALEPVKPAVAVECPRRHGDLRVEVVQMPAQPAPDVNGTFFAKQGSLSAPWIGETGTGAKAIAAS